MKITPVHIARTNDNIVKNNQTSANMVSRPSFQAKTVLTPKETKNVLKLPIAAGIAIGTAVVLRISRIKTYLIQGTRKDATPEQFARHGIYVKDVDEKDGLYTVDDFFLGCLCSKEDNKKQQRFIRRHAHQIKIIKGLTYISGSERLSLTNLEMARGFFDMKNCNKIRLGNKKTVFESSIRCTNTRNSEINADTIKFIGCQNTDNVTINAREIAGGNYTNAQNLKIHVTETKKI